MTETKPPAPILELIVEIRWNSNDAINFSPDGSISCGPEADMLAEKLAELGFGQSAPVQPPGTVAFGLPLVRYRNKKDPATLYQFGPGVFTCNATLPYESWKTFRPKVAQGVKLLLETFTPEKLSRLQVAMRYMDLFKRNLHMHGEGPVTFLQNIGFIPQAPAFIRTRSNSLALYRSNLAFTLNDSTDSLFVNFGEQGEDLLLDTGVVRHQSAPPTMETLMQELDLCQKLLHDFFVDSIQPHIGAKP